MENKAGREIIPSGLPFDSYTYSCRPPGGAKGNRLDTRASLSLYGLAPKLTKEDAEGAYDLGDEDYQINNDDAN